MSGVEPVTRERARALIEELTEVLTGRQEPTTHSIRPSGRVSLAKATLCEATVGVSNNPTI